MDEGNRTEKLIDEYKTLKRVFGEFKKALQEHAVLNKYNIRLQHGNEVTFALGLPFDSTIVVTFSIVHSNARLFGRILFEAVFNEKQTEKLPSALYFNTDKKICESFRDLLNEHIEKAHMTTATYLRSLVGSLLDTYLSLARFHPPEEMIEE